MRPSKEYVSNFIANVKLIWVNYLVHPSVFQKNECLLNADCNSFPLISIILVTKFCYDPSAIWGSFYSSIVNCLNGAGRVRFDVLVGSM